MSSALIGASVFLALSSVTLVAPILLQAIGKLLGWHLRRRTESRRAFLVEEARKGNKKSTKGSNSSGINPGKATEPSNCDWDGIIGFFHPFCNAGGGGERVLWAAIRATQETWPNAICVVYTGDHDVNKEQILQRVHDRFNIRLRAHSLVFLYLSKRRYVLSSTWPRFTLLGQSLGSLILAFDAFTLLPPDIFIDTMGYAFALGLSKLLFLKVPTAAYVHYPTISTDMLSSLDDNTSSANSKLAHQTTTRGLNAGAGAGFRGFLKRQYWHLFAALYTQAGASIDVVMTNSSWTQSHITSLWQPLRVRRGSSIPISVVFPPVAVQELEDAIEISPATESHRDPVLLYIAQFRPEKNHSLLLHAFSTLLANRKAANLATTGPDAPKLVLLGSARDSADETHVYSLRLLAHELHITDSVTFVLNAPWPAILSHLRTAHAGVNAMWNEHFGIGVVEYQAAGLLCVVNDSGGPRADIVKDLGDGETGWRAGTCEEYAAAFAEALKVRGDEAVEWRMRARRSARRFTEDVFERAWVEKVGLLVDLRLQLLGAKQKAG